MYTYVYIHKYKSLYIYIHIYIYFLWMDPFCNTPSRRHAGETSPSTSPRRSGRCPESVIVGV